MYEWQSNDGHYFQNEFEFLNFYSDWFFLNTFIRIFVCSSFLRIATFPELFPIVVLLVGRDLPLSSKLFK